MAYNIGQGLGINTSIGRVIQVNPNTYTALVYIMAGKGRGSTPECAIRSLSNNRLSKTAVVFMPEIGDEVYLDWSYGTTPVICDYTPKLTPGEDDKEYATEISPIKSFGGEDRD